MQVHHDERVAIRIDPESCAGVREDTGEALTGEDTGQPLSLVMNIVPGADALSNVEGNTDGRAIASTRTARRGRRTWHVSDASCAGTGRSHGRPTTQGDLRCAGPHREGEEPEPMMHDCEKSHSAIVAAKPTNNAPASKADAAEPVEPRAGTKRKAEGQSTLRTQGRERVSQALDSSTESRRPKEEGKVHRALPPSQHRYA